ncbi:hypothetical protein GCM10011579_055200 [Streptomyces albiflavescens]|uniref:Uncharacterized protein n=1 Tax=Streptomyces albiflavescens TaxID=1623582 RepID=A0A918D791_9ACTN|nr:hypothetical protein GCM10011579_055200 [Streptomyces albiflavescens]
MFLIKDPRLADEVAELGSALAAEGGGELGDVDVRCADLSLSPVGIQ